MHNSWRANFSCSRPLAGWLGGALCLVALAGCGRSGDTGGAAATDHAATTSSSVAGQPGGADDPGGKLLTERWDAMYIHGGKVGYAHTVVAAEERGGKQLIHTRSLNRLSLARFGQDSTGESRMSSWEDADGQLVEFENETTLGPTPEKTSGHVLGVTMMLSSGPVGEPPKTSVMKWPTGVRGFNATEDSLNKRPMHPGETRALKLFMPVFNQVVDVTLAAKDIEAAPLLVGSQRLLRVEAVMTLPNGAKLETVLWTDENGETLKSRMEAMETFRTTKEIAEANPKAEHFDLGLETLVKLDRPLAQGHKARRAVYRVELISGDPTSIFASGVGQTVRAIGPRAAEITVTAIDPEKPSGAEEAAGDEDREPNSMVQSSDPSVVEMAKQGAPPTAKGWALASALEEYVHRTISNKNFKQAFATAADVVKSREGDCTEHAVLLAALLRARGLPSRVAIGLVYMERAQAFGYHMWTEVNIDGRWRPLDATLGRAGIGAGHLRLTSSSLKDESAFSSFLPVAQVIGRIKIGLKEAE